MRPKAGGGGEMNPRKLFLNIKAKSPQNSRKFTDVPQLF